MRRGQDFRLILSFNEQALFWSRVNKQKQELCWPWLGAPNGWGYGSFWVNDKQFYSHRIAWSLVNGAIMPKLFVCHHCDNPICCNPSHLFIGTCADNNRDAFAKQRNKPPTTNTGEQHHCAKLTERDVRLIRSLYSHAGLSYRDIANIFSVDHTTIGRAITGKSWSRARPTGVLHGEV